MNRRGQALVEFVLILPVFLIILLVVVDFGNLLYEKNKLESASSDMVRMIKNDVSLSEVDDYADIEVKIRDYKDNYKKVIFSKAIKINTPFLDRILGNPCLIETERVIIDE